VFLHEEVHLMADYFVRPKFVERVRSGGECHVSVVLLKRETYVNNLQHERRILRVQSYLRR
jgi:hypothetical protein